MESIRRWWHELGQTRYTTATRILITADCGGSNGVRVPLWKTKLQTLADQTGLSITIAHLPPGTSKWNRIEHRLFAFITVARQLGWPVRDTKVVRSQRSNTAEPNM